jgi:hypothetical protein
MLAADLASGVGRRRSRDDAHALAFDRGLLLVPLIAATFFSKFALPPLGELGISIGVGVILLAVVVGAVWGRIELAPGSLLVFLLFMAFLGLSPLYRGVDFSPLSVLFTAALHFPYVLRVKGAQDRTDEMLKLFSDYAVFFACCGIVQFGLQFVIGSALAFPIENFVPDLLQVQAFNKQGALAYGSEIYRSNGIFMLEPSFYSQLMAVAIVSELCSANRLWRLALYAAALVLSYSGTGMIVLAICLPIAAVFYGRWQLIPLGLLSLGLLYIAADLLSLDLFVQRAGEFDSTGSSAFARFVGGFYLFDQFLWDSPVHTLLGYGPGSFKDYAALATVPVAEMAMPKMIFEYGLVGGLSYFILLGVAVFSCGGPLLVRLAIYVTYFLSGNLIVFTHGLALTLLIWPKGQPVSRMGHVSPYFRRRHAQAPT